MVHVLLSHVPESICPAGQAPYDHALLRQTSSLLRSLPAMESKQFKQEYIMVCAFASRPQ